MKHTIDPFSNSVEWYSMSCCDDSLLLESCSVQCDIASFRVQENWQVSAAHIVPLSCSMKIPDKDAVKIKDETLLAQVHYHRDAQGYQ